MTVREPEHVLVYRLIEAGVNGEQLSAQALVEDVAPRVGGTGHAINYLVEIEGMKPARAEQMMRKNPVPVQWRMLLHEVQGLKERGWIVEENGHLELGALPKSYDPVKREQKERSAAKAYSLRETRRRKDGWSGWWTYSQSVVETMKDDMRINGWPKNLTILLDADGKVADGKHRIAAAEALGIDWRQHTKTIKDEFKLAEEVARRNAGRNWSMSPKQVVEIAGRLSTDLGVVTGVELARRTGTSERTAQRATRQTRTEQKGDRDQAILVDIDAGMPQRAIAKKHGVSQATVSRMMQKRHGGGSASPETEQADEPGATESPPRVEIGTCAVCSKTLYEDESIAQVIRPKILSSGASALLAVPVRAEGGANQLIGPFEKLDAFGHKECFEISVQQFFEEK